MCLGPEEGDFRAHCNACRSMCESPLFGRLSCDGRGTCFELLADSRFFSLSRREAGLAFHIKPFDEVDIVSRKLLHTAYDVCLAADHPVLCRMLATEPAPGWQRSTPRFDSSGTRFPVSRNGHGQIQFISVSTPRICTTCAGSMRAATSTGWSIRSRGRRARRRIRCRTNHFWGEVPKHSRPGLR